MKRTTITWAVVILLLFAGIVFAAKWSDYDSMTAGTIADADTFMVLDVSDTTMAATGTQKQYPWSVLKADAKTYFDTLYEDGLGVPAGDDYILSSKIDGTRSWVEIPTDFDPDEPGPIGGTTPNTAVFTTLEAGGGDFAVDGSGNVTAASVTVSKVSGTAGALRMYEANSTDVLTSGFRGAASQTEAYEGQFPNAKPNPDAGDYVLMGWPAQSAGDGTAGNPYVHALTAITLDDGAGNGDTTKLWSADKVYDSLTAGALNWYTTGTIAGGSLTPVIGDADDFDDNFTGQNLYGGTYIVNAAGTIILPNATVGMNFTIVLEAAVATVIDPLGTGTADTIVMNGLAAAADENITSSTLGAMCVFQYRSADKWMATCNGFAEATPP